MSATQRIHVTVSLIIFITSLPATATIPDGARAINVSGGENHTLVLTALKTVWGCGDNFYYQLGIGNKEDQATLAQVHGPNDVNYLEDINDIDAGWKHSLALDINSFVWAWGDNYEGQLGDGTQSDRSTPVRVKSGDQDPGDPSSFLRYIECISAGRSGEHSLAVDANGFAWAWGRNNTGQLGNGQDGTGERELVPIQVLSGEQDPSNPNSVLMNIIAVSAGEEHSMALEKLEPNDSNCNGHVYTWGDNEFLYGGRGKLGNGNITDGLIATPVTVKSGEQDPDPNSFLENIVAISAGWDHCMALEKLDPNDPNCNGRVYTWGNNGEGYDSPNGGRLGNGTIGDSSTPVMVLSGEQDPNDATPLKDIIAISAGEGHCMALDVNGFVWTWGDNVGKVLPPEYGQLGNGTYDPCTTPVQVVGPDGQGYLENIVAISAGFWHSLAPDP